MYFILFYDVIDDFLERRAPYRSEHLALAQESHAQGKLLLAGAFANPADGAALIFRASDRAEVEAFAESDPYVKNGLVTRWRVREWSVVIGDD